MEPWEWAEMIIGQAEESRLRARFLPMAERTMGQYRRGILTSLELVQKLYEECIQCADDLGP